MSKQQGAVQGRKPRLAQSQFPRELAGPTEQIGEEAMEAYIRSFDTPMTDKAVKAVRMLTSLDSGPALLASAQVAAAEEGAGLEKMAE